MGRFLGCFVKKTNNCCTRLWFPWVFCPCLKKQTNQPTVTMFNFKKVVCFHQVACAGFEVVQPSFYEYHFGKAWGFVFLCFSLSFSLLSHHCASQKCNFKAHTEHSPLPKPPCCSHGRNCYTSKSVLLMDTLILYQTCKPYPGTVFVQLLVLTVIKQYSWGDLALFFPLSKYCGSKWSNLVYKLLKTNYSYFPLILRCLSFEFAGSQACFLWQEVWSELACWFSENYCVFFAGAGREEVFCTADSIRQAQEQLWEGSGLTYSQYHWILFFF